MDNELFELCKSVYEKTDWEWPGTTEKSFNPGTSHAIQFGWMNGSIPLYTSDYLLEKLPNFLLLKSGEECWLKLMPATEDSFSVVYSNKDSVLYHKNSGTPLKALLKMCLALHEAKLLEAN